MALASLFGGVALANARLGAVHGLAGPLGGMFPAPHGMICARLLPLVIQTNINALQDRAPDSPAIKRLNEVARILTGFPNATVGDGVTWLQELCSELGVSPLSRFGVSEKDVPQVVLQAQRASSMKGNPISLNDGELADILQRAL
jgi:alcohol dehydrogenase class IV